jgi:uncharacterized protein YxeA
MNKNTKNIIFIILILVCISIIIYFIMKKEKYTHQKTKYIASQNQIFSKPLEKQKSQFNIYSFFIFWLVISKQRSFNSLCRGNYYRY